MLHLNIAEGCGPTGQILGELLTERGVRYDTNRTRDCESVVCWGNGSTDRLPALNRNATQHNKLQQLQVLSAPESHNLRTVPFYASGNFNNPALFPMFMRKLSHAGGTDIRLALEPQQASLYLTSGWNFGTKYVPTLTEYRVWVYRRQHLGTYEKHLARPQEFLSSRRFGANFDNGYSFRLVPTEALPTAAIEMAKAAVQALGLDFGAVDILKGRDNQFYILEVNTAPGVEGPDRQVIQALANKIAYWVNHNYPRRSGGESEYERPGAAETPAPRRRAAAATTESPAPSPAVGDRPSFLPRPGESQDAWFRRMQAQGV